MKNLFVSILVVCLYVTAPANLDFQFLNITNNDPINSEVGESQLSGNVINLGGGQVLFTIINGPEQCVVTDIYFEDLAGMLAFNSFEVNFERISFREKEGSTLNLPGGNQPWINFIESFGFEPEEPQPIWGIGPNKSLGLLFDIGGSQFEDIATALNNNELRIGLHVQDFANGNSESFVSYVPEPATMVLFLMGTALVRKSKKR